jgi:hypothetical protein
MVDAGVSKSYKFTSGFHALQLVRHTQNADKFVELEKMFKTRLRCQGAEIKLNL